MPYAEAARALLRESVLDALGDLLRQRDWSAVTMSDVSRRAGVSRQTLYNEFGSRQGLAQGYALRLAHRLVDAVGDAIYSHVGDIHGALHSGFSDFFAESAADPMVISLITGEAKPELMRIVTVDSALIVVPASARLTESFMNSWVAASEEDAAILARSIVRLAISYVSMPPESDHDVALDMARLLSPFVEANALADKAPASGGFPQ
ncbi:TetR family transcriptional regulator [Mycobacteroides saopaulense]|uniref:TetR family transcriptional regulator n=1 Tax=Mycobacteroides saopaulense TaxID=1578165 RepID=A0A1S4VR79_9MYCO|nr:TetR family transcriptional regulator [Mycobacteroides saopaulense]ALR14300.1 TetR family transcriptional regulator [Mycobacteroides saopaulense]ORB60291.1 TetR family transcriptional regulator [Mycobacteroides saopaulense]